VNGFTCGERITHLFSEETHLYSSKLEACHRIAGIEFPDLCGMCDPTLCDGKQINVSPRDSYCGCTQCNLHSWKLDSGDGLSCEAKITWTQMHNPLYSLEKDACKLIALQFPQTCGMDCNPDKCISEIHSDTPNEIPGSTSRIPSQTPVIYPSVPMESDFRPTPRSPPIEKQMPIIPSEPETDSTINQSMFGANVWIMDSTTMTTAQVQGAFDDLYYRQVHNEMGSERYSIFFLPGVYGSTSDPLYLKIGYYTEVAGLGALPGDVLINGKVEVYNRCFVPNQYIEGKFVPFDGDSGMCFALNNFWRSLSNVAINIVSLGQDECRKTAMFWAISQASSMRRVDIRGGDVSLMDYCSRKF
jgi:hypothetical protein